MKGYTEEILRVNLTTRKIDVIPTDKYKPWVGGHGMGAAIFFDLVGDKIVEMQDGFHPANVLTIMTSPLTGTLVPACAGRIEMQGVGVQSDPIGWFTRSNFGGRFAMMLKHAGWDGIVIEGSADRPVWLDIRDKKVAIRNCDELSLWGQDAWESQQTIWDFVANGGRYRRWYDPGGTAGGMTTQRPAVAAIGPAGENECRTACVIHDASNASGQGGFGAVWGKKQLKAVSVIGSGGVHVAHPKELLEARLWLQQNYGYKLGVSTSTELDLAVGGPPMPYLPFGDWQHQKPGEQLEMRPKEGQRPQACVGCHAGCHARFESGVGNEAGCLETMLCPDAESIEVQRHAADLLNRNGLNAWEMVFTLSYIRDLNKRELLGPDKAINSPLDFSDYGTLPFVTRFLEMAATQKVNGKKHPFAVALSEGAYRAARTWNRLETDLKSGDLPYAHWAIPTHFDPRTELEWGYGTILGDRDVNEHDFMNVWGRANEDDWYGRPIEVPAAEAVRIVQSRLVPFHEDPKILDYGSENMYSAAIAKLTSWHRYYTRFWKGTVQFCDWRWPDFVNLNVPDKVGCTGTAEPRFYNAVTGGNLSFAEGIELGRKIWNLDQVIWTLQGRHRDQVKFADFIYEQEAKGTPEGYKNLLPVCQNGNWSYADCLGRKLDRTGVENFKTEFYRLQGWDESTGYPKRDTLEEMGLSDQVASLERAGRLG